MTARVMVMPWVGAVTTTLSALKNRTPSGRIEVDSLIEKYKVASRVQEQAPFTKEHLPPAREGWAMDTFKGACNMAPRLQALKHQANMLHLEAVRGPPAARCKRAFKAGDLVRH
eukprot:5513482-Pyramimonas_sp.AAC.1